MTDTNKYPNARELRDWANARGARDIANSGRLPRHVVLAWNKAHPDRPYVAAEGFHGTPAGYNLHDCRCDRCLIAGREDSRLRESDRRDGAA